MIATGGTALRSMVWPSEPSVATSSSWTILTTIWPGVTDLTTVAPTACSRTRSVKLRTTSSETSASSSARRTSRIAASTSASDSEPRPVSRSRMPPSFSDRLSNNAVILVTSPRCRSRSDRPCDPREGVQEQVRAPHPRRRSCKSGARENIVQTLLRPRAHRAVGRWPPVSRAGRRVEKNVFSRSRRVKPPERGKVKESCAGLPLYLRQGIVIADISGIGNFRHANGASKACVPFLLCMGLFSRFCVWPLQGFGCRRVPVGPAHAIYPAMPLVPSVRDPPRAHHPPPYSRSARRSRRGRRCSVGLD